MDTSADSPVSVRFVADSIRGWVGRLGSVWIEGQIAQANARQDLVFATLRDTGEDCSVGLIMSRKTAHQIDPPLAEGQRVVVQAKPEYWKRRGDLKLRVHAVRAVGIGDLLARLEQLKAQMAAEGLFAPERKRPLPFLPGRIGLISGRGSDAQRDVIVNAQRRWPGAQFELRETPVQGDRAVSEIVRALDELQLEEGVDVIVIARGGGSTEELLAFSNETLVRAVAQAHIPVVSAIGHEKDNPILDHVADLRASTPTDAGRRIVPDMSEETRRAREARQRCRRALDTRLRLEEGQLAQLRAHSQLADPLAGLRLRSQRVSDVADRTRRAAAAMVEREGSEISSLAARVRTLSPAATLERGYAVVQRRDDAVVVRDPEQVAQGQQLRVRLAHGEFTAVRQE